MFPCSGSSSSVPREADCHRSGRTPGRIRAGSHPLTLVVFPPSNDPSPEAPCHVGAASSLFVYLRPRFLSLDPHAPAWQVTAPSPGVVSWRCRGRKGVGAPPAAESPEKRLKSQKPARRKCPRRPASTTRKEVPELEAAGRKCPRLGASKARKEAPEPEAAGPNNPRLRAPKA